MESLSVHNLNTLTESHILKRFITLSTHFVCKHFLILKSLNFINWKVYLGFQVKFTVLVTWHYQK